MAQKKETKKNYFYAIGRRKSSIATIRLFKGKGEDIWVNKETPIKERYLSEREQTYLYKPFLLTDTNGKFHFHTKTTGGGKSGQLGAIRLAISRALLKVDDSFRSPLKKAGMLVRDPREKERKKPGLRKARKQEQYSKR